MDVMGRMNKTKIFSRATLYRAWKKQRSYIVDIELYALMSNLTNVTVDNPSALKEFMEKDIIGVGSKPFAKRAS